MRNQLATLIIRLPEELHKKLKEEARSRGLSLNKHCVSLLGGRESGAEEQRVIKPAVRASQSFNLSHLADSIIDQYGSLLQAVVLYGSLPRGEASGSSDIDLLIVVRDDVELDRDLYSEWKIREFQHQEVSPLFLHLPAAREEIRGIWLEAALDGVVLFDRDFRVSGFLSEARRMIASGRVKRRMTHGHPYWVRQRLDDDSRTKNDE